MSADRPPPLELEEIADLEFEFMEELMAEPPHGHNHGRSRGEAGWHPLETDPADSPSFKRFVEKPRQHGTPYTYQKIGCRCDLCRAWKRGYNREKRNPSG